MYLIHLAILLLTNFLGFCSFPFPYFIKSKIPLIVRCTLFQRLKCEMGILQLMYYGIRNNAANEHIAYNFHMCISVDVF